MRPLTTERPIFSNSHEKHKKFYLRIFIYSVQVSLHNCALKSCRHFYANGRSSPFKDKNHKQQQKKHKRVSKEGTVISKGTVSAFPDHGSGIELPIKDRSNCSDNRLVHLCGCTFPVSVQNLHFPAKLFHLHKAVL